MSSSKPEDTLMSQGRRLSNDTESYPSDDEFTYHERTSASKKWRQLAWLWLGRLLLLFAVSTTSFWAGSTKKPTWGDCVRQTSEYSPGLSAISKPYQKIRFRGGFDSDSPYKGPPSPAVDAAWNRIAEMGVIRISKEELHQLNASKYASEIPKSLGGGFMGLPEFVHQIHCVHMLWKNIYPDYYEQINDEIFADRQEMLDHMNHCADMLRQKLMCDADMGIITYNWRKHHYRPHPNFNVQHKCRDFEAGLEWGLERQIDASSLENDYFTRPDKPVVDFDIPPFDPLAEE